MKNIKFIITLLVFVVLLTPTFAPAQNGAIKLGGVLEFDKAKYDAAINKAMLGNVMGYQVILIKNGKIVSEIAGGNARNAADGNVKMTVNTPANIGSTAKFFGGTALLRKFEKNPRSGGIQAWLDEPIYKYFPKIWQENMHASIKQIRFIDLLQHRSGFIPSDKETNVYFDYLAKGVSNDKSREYAFGKRKYANANITSVGYLLPLVANPQLLETLNKKIAEKKLKPDDIFIQSSLGNIFEMFMNREIFSKIAPQISPTCDAPNEYPKKNIIYAKMYNIWNDISKGDAVSSKTDNITKACHAAGGWYVSSRELAAYVANFSAAKTIVSAETRDLMFDDKMPDERILWSSARGGTLLKSKLNWNSSPYMGGDHGGAHATIVMLPNGYYAVGIVNSAISPVKKGDEYGGSAAVTQNIIEAFEAGIAANF